jgi:hypothetical protein
MLFHENLKGKNAGIRDIISINDTKRFRQCKCFSQFYGSKYEKETDFLFSINLI